MMVGRFLVPFNHDLFCFIVLVLSTVLSFWTLDLEMGRKRHRTGDMGHTTTSHDIMNFTLCYVL